MSDDRLREHSETKMIPLAYEQAEEIMPGAPVILIDDEHGCIPQHFLQYNHSYESVIAIIEDIEFSKKYPIFSSEDEQALYVQIGVVGYDNYKHRTLDDPKHIVYGRKWRIEKNLPSGEIIQTIFLALKKAREHEVRELLRLKSKTLSRKSTPFSGHHDIPLLSERLRGHAVPRPNTNIDPETLLQELLSRLDFDRQPIVINEIQPCSKGRFLVDLQIVSKTMPPELAIFPELMDQEFSILVDALDHNTVYHAIMDALIEMSDHYVDEHFKYRGFARFSRSADLEEIGNVSIILRSPEALNCPDFTDYFRSVNYAVDSTRAPILKDNDFATKIMSDLKSLGEISGHLPKT